MGSLIAWQRPEHPVVINGMAVVRNRQGKLRFILDCRYAKNFVTYEHFACEKLHDMTADLSFTIAIFKASLPFAGNARIEHYNQV